MHVLLLNQYFPPDTSATAKMADLVAQALARRHQVTVLAGRPSYDSTVPHPYYFRRRESRGSLVVERVGSTAYPRRRMRHRVTNYLSYLAFAFPRAVTIKADMVLSMTDPPIAGIIGAWVARLTDRTFIYNIRDLYPDMALAAGIVRPARWVSGWERLHRWALRQADRIVVLGDDMRERVLAKGVESGRVVVIRDGAPVPAATVPCNHPIAREIRSGFSFVMLHAGNLGFYGAWETLIRACRLLDGQDIGLVFVGDGAAKAHIEALVDGCGRIRFLPFRPPQELPYVLAAADIHVVTVRSGLEGIVVPSKFYAILAAGRPVLALTPETSDVARITQRGGCGIVANPNEPGLVARAIKNLAADQPRLQAMGQRARIIARDYERQRELDRFVRVIEEVSAP